MNQCDLHSSCITGDLQIALEAVPAQYTAGAEGDVFFGWAEEGTGATCIEDPNDPNDGTCIPPTLYDEENPLGHEAYKKPAGLISIRATFAGFPSTFECITGVACELGVECTEARVSRIPDSELISFPIQQEAP